MSWPRSSILLVACVLKRDSILDCCLRGARRRRARAKPLHRPVLEPIGCRNEANFSRALTKLQSGSHLRQSIDLRVIPGDAFYGESTFECFPNFDAIERL